MNVAKGKFEVTLKPLDAPKEVGGNKFGRMSIDKTFIGDLVGISQGQMLSANTAIDSSAGYVAIERVEGTIDGRSGQFVLQHHGLMSAASQSLEIAIVPDSGTGDFTGISGSMKIIFAPDGHQYEMEYEIYVIS